jgi:hypothetical protein
MGRDGCCHECCHSPRTLVRPHEITSVPSRRPHLMRTMEAADALYGVSMAGDGVSNVISRRLPRAVEEVA